MDTNLEFHCDLKGLCRSCVLCRPPFQCCYQEFSLTRRECNFSRCPFSSFCPHANLKSFKSRDQDMAKTLDILSGNHFKNTAVRLPSHFIPEIMPMRQERQEAISIAKSAKVPLIAVSLQNFFHGIHETILLREARKRGLHKFMDYSGEIILTTDVKDRLCDHFVQSPVYFRTIVEQLRPDYLTTFDTYTYNNIPAGIARIKMLEVASSLGHLMDSEAKIIGLAVGSTPDQVFSYVEFLTRLGCKIIAQPVYEFRRKADTDSIRWRIWLTRELGAKVFLLSCSPGFTARRRVYADYYSSWSWFSSVSSRDKVEYKKRRAKLLRMLTLSKKCSEQAKLGGS